MIKLKMIWKPLASVLPFRGRKRGLLLFLLFFLSPAACTLSQPFLARPDENGDVTFSRLEQSFHDWSKGKDLSSAKGWKWYQRWENFYSSRLNPDGTLPDEKISLAECVKAAQWKKSLSKNSGSFIWTPVGPSNLAIPAESWMETGIGRINCVAFHPTDPNTLWVGVAQGGVWKSVNGGNSWMPLTDDLPVLRISDIAVDPIHPDTIYISVGDYAYLGIGLKEDDRKRNTHFGLGVYKTIDGGVNWSPTGLTFQLTDFDGSLTRRVFIHPSNTENLLAAGIHGIWKSSNGGGAWTQILDTAIWDIERDPANPDILYASSAFIENLQMGTAGIMKTTDFGNTWTWLNTGIPAQNTVQRIELAIAPSDPSCVYALACDPDGGFYALYRSVNGGGSWTVQSQTTPNILEWYDGSSTGGQGTYDLVILVDPIGKDRVYAGGINLWGSADGGVTWYGISFWHNAYGPSIHADQHFLARSPLNDRFYICDDGGIYFTDSIAIGSWNDAFNIPGYQWPTQWTKISGGMNVTSFYRLGTSVNNQGYIIAGAQDNSTYYYNMSDWYNIIGGDGMECIIDPFDPNVLYGSYQYGSIMVSYDGGLSSNNISSGIGESGEWTTPYVMDPADNNTIYAAFGNVWKTADAGASWNPISNFPIISMLGQPNKSSALAVAPSDPAYIYVAKRIYFPGNEPSALWKTADGGSSWIDVTAGLPDSLYLTYIAVDNDAPNTAWVTCGGWIPGIKVFRTSDGGGVWQNISGNLPNLPVNCIVHHANAPNNPVYIGTDIGVWYKNDTLAAWELFSDGLPNVIVTELEIHLQESKLYASTFGRGLWSVGLKDTSQISGVNSFVAQEFNLSLMPLVNDGNFKLEITGAQKPVSMQFQILDITGKKVFEEPLQFPGGNFPKTYSLELSFGIYYATIRSGLQNRTVRFVIIH